jgi:hypothetical protein
MARIEGMPDGLLKGNSPAVAETGEFPDDHQPADFLAFVGGNR